MWPDLIQKSKDGGLDVIETYVFWNIHEPARNQVLHLSVWLDRSLDNDEKWNLQRCFLNLHSYDAEAR